VMLGGGFRLVGENDIYPGGCHGVKWSHAEPWPHPWKPGNQE
jgi:hypothetical protein